VPGLNDVIGKPAFVGTCTTCHDTPNVGDHSLPSYLDLGLTDPARITPDLPQYTLKNLSTGATRVTSDPGRALITGKWSDIGKFKVPTLRGLAARAPYFHNGSAAGIGDVLNFYNQRFNIGFTQQERADLTAFLNSL
jgi:cytochrome c peroxidase